MLSYISPLRLDFEEEPQNKVDYKLVPYLRGEFLEGITYDLRVERTRCMAGVSRECVGSELRREGYRPGTGVRARRYGHKSF